MSHLLDRPLSPALRRRQSGVSLVVVLVLLIAISVLGIAVLRSSAMQERMSANLRDRSIAFQATESALRFAQEAVLGNPPDPGNPAITWDSWLPTAATCTDGTAICPSGSRPADNQWARLPAAAYDTARLPEAPEYWIEFLGRGPSVVGGCEVTGPAREINCQNPIYRITARTRSDGRADVVMQASVISRRTTSGS